jgi:succinoglycan biosynthesis protein ExoA
MDTPANVVTVIPTWQESEHIERCLRSLMQQTHPAHAHRILVMDGGSSDGTVEIVENLAAESMQADGPIIELHHNPFRYVPQARNLAMDLMGDDVEFVLEMIGHAWVPKQHLEIRIRRLLEIEKHTGDRLGGLGCLVLESDQPMGQVESWVEATLASPLGGSGQFARFKKDGPTKIPPFVLYRRDALLQAGGWNEAFITTQDSELNLRIIQMGRPMWRTKDTHVRMAKRKTINQWWRLGHRYGFWRMKHLISSQSRARVGEFLPWFGLALVLGLAIDGQSLYLGPVGIPWVLMPILAYLLTITGVGVNEAYRAKDWSLSYGVPLLLLLLHTSFSIGLLDGLIRKGKPPQDRVAEPGDV